MEEKNMTYFIYIGAAMLVFGIIMIAIGVSGRKTNPATEAVPEVAKEAVEATAEPEEEQAVDEAEEIPVEETGSEEAEQEVSEEPATMGGFQIDPIPEINQLLETYYAAYASADLEKLEICASPISELEKSYVKLMSDYTESTTDVQCYVKPGLNEGEYAVSVMAKTKLKDVNEAAPGLDFFYVKKNADGTYVIDNLYCSFNRSVKVLDMDASVAGFIDSYEKEEDFKVLQETVQGDYDEMLASNEALNDKLRTEIPQAVNDWMSRLSGTDKKNDDKVAEGTTLTARDSFNVRDGMSDNDKKIGTVKEGETFKVIKHYDGWTKIKWNDESGYIKTELLAEYKENA